MNRNELWHEFCLKEKLDESIVCRTFLLNSAKKNDDLAMLSINGMQFGAAKFNNEDESSKPGEYRALLLASGEAVCILKNTDVYIKDTSKVFCYHGSCDLKQNKTLTTWRTKDDGVVCEKFSVEYFPNDSAQDKLIDKFCEA